MKLKSAFSACLFSLIVLALFSCKNDQEESFGKFQLKFAHKVNGNELKCDTLVYTNAAGNQYMVNDIQYFISDIDLINNEGQAYRLKADGFAHYADTDIPSTLIWNVKDQIPSDNYKAIRFVFGFTPEHNISNQYPNQPESDMFWPESLGGGYHYMKLNGKWLKPGETIPTPFNFHLGIGQVYSGTKEAEIAKSSKWPCGSIITKSKNDVLGFVHNQFIVNLPVSFLITKDNTTSLELVMNVESWFETPNIWNHNTIGSSIMQNQQAQIWAKENGQDVFSISAK